MARAPFQVLVFPYRWRADGTPAYALFQRADSGAWQPIAGGGEDAETPEDSAAREAAEEGGVPRGAALFRLDSVGAVGVEHFRDRALWDPDLTELPEYCFAVALDTETLNISREHHHAAWQGYEEALAMLTWESNRRALRELHERLGSGVASAPDARAVESD
jgi:dATP pyrophosphohydrolase